METQITVRDVNNEVFRTFKASAIKKGLNIGAALTLAMEHFTEELKEKQLKFSKHKPVSWGKGTEKTSEEVDTILFGD